MSSNVNEMNYQFVNKNLNLYYHNNLNKLVISENENLNHFSCKAILFYIFSELNHDVICDYHIVGVGLADIFDISSRTIYLFEASGLQKIQKNINELYERSEIDVVVINVEDLPNNLFQRYLRLREYTMHS